ncbi:MAG: 2-oxo acid dehydrogenase subunit E2 [Boseongicola sp.]|nr:2-oxo acid dehydrogenase subunit E2 [Boseongicola sp.]
MSEFRMPSLGSDMEAGTLVEQSVAPGETVKRGDVIGAVETQKGVIEIEVFQEGVLDKWLVDLGTTVPVGAPLAMILEAGEKPQEALPPDTEPLPPETVPTPPETVPTPPDVDPVHPDTRPTEPDIAPSPPEVPETTPPEPTRAPPEVPPSPTVEPDSPAPEIEPFPEAEPPPSRMRITPAARRLAAQRGIDPVTLVSASGDVLTRRDLEATPPSKSSPVTTDFRAAIAAAMSRSKREIPHYYLSHDVDLTAAEAFVTTQNAGRPPTERLLLGAVCAKAIATALKKYPEFNGHYVNDQFQPSKAVHLGFAINIRSGGLVAPALFDADSQDLDALMLSMRDLTARVRAGRFRARELSEATVTLTSLGERGTDAVFGVIYPPQVAIVGMGAPRLRPALHENTVTARLQTTLTLAADHRVSDGSRGALLLRAIDAQLQKPETL